MNCLAIVLLVLCWMYTCPVAVDITNVDDHDPGSCDQSNALQVYSVNDRNGEKKLWICSDELENGKYLWKPVDGDAYRGEFLYPADDCSDVLNHDVDATSGFYWITLGVATKRKVWCDMTTDGGGYILVARKHDAITWDIPSKDQPADPSSSETYWTSQLGDAQILDFRIQFSDTSSFDDPKAHWSYRLKNKRPLGQLMITDSGCSVLEPGIGDIAFVKDLLTESIVSTTFECSIFGGVQSSGQLGWSMMNQCLMNPCSGSGYFHHKGMAIAALDHTGVFSYSASGRASGLNYNATVSVGCVSTTCCACYGPVGQKGDYCNAQCNTANGGTTIDSKNVYTWVWVRPSLPKQIWERCMEYQSQDESGQTQWYTLTGDSVIPEEGRCPDNELRLNSGVVVASNNETSEKVPKIPGILEYRKDQEKLYLRENKTWNPLAEEKDVEDIQKELTELKESVDANFEKMEVKNQATDAELIRNLTFAFPNYNSIVDAGKRYPECTEYKWLRDADRHYAYYNSNYEKCDNYLSGWYRFGGAAGTQMYTSCRHSHYYCHTIYPGYMSGGHPSVSDGKVSRTVYFYRDGNCHRYSKTIQVINCAGLYYVYELNGTPACRLRYCSQ